MKNFEYVAQDGTTISMYLWSNVAKPKGVVQIVHGMSEHMGRYEELAQKLNEAGFVVVGDDHRGHGKTAGAPENVGKAMGDIFYKTMKDEAFITDNVKKVYPGLPYFVLGHSYGSFITQKYIQTNSKKVDGVILTGSGCQKGNFVNFLGSVICQFAKKPAPAKLFQKMSFDSYDKKFSDGRWITRDKAISDKYYADPYCTQVFSFGFYKSLFFNFRRLYKTTDMEKIRKDLPVFLASGDKDPVGGKEGKSVQKLKDLYGKFGLTDVTMKLYQNARHEVLNETNREEVYGDVVDFLNRAIETKIASEEQAAKEKAERAEYFKKALEESVVIEKQFQEEKAAAATRVLTKKELRAKKKAEKNQ